MNIPVPLDRHREIVKPEWIDYNGHMNVAYYALAFDHATDVFLDAVGLDAAHRDVTGGSTFSVDSRIQYLRELSAGDPIRITTQLLACDARRLYFFHTMYHATEGYVAATSEWLNLYIDLNLRRVVDLPGEIQRGLREWQMAHRALGWPEQAGRPMRVPNPET